MPTLERYALVEVGGFAHSALHNRPPPGSFAVSLRPPPGCDGILSSLRGWNTPSESALETAPSPPCRFPVRRRVDRTVISTASQQSCAIDVLPRAHTPALKLMVAQSGRSFEWRMRGNTLGSVGNTCHTPRACAVAAAVASSRLAISESMSWSGAL